MHIHLDLLLKQLWIAQHVAPCNAGNGASPGEASVSGTHANAHRHTRCTHQFPEPMMASRCLFAVIVAGALVLYARKRETSVGGSRRWPVHGENGPKNGAA